MIETVELELLETDNNELDLDVDFEGECIYMGSGGNGDVAVSPTATVTQTNNGATITITDKNGTTSAKITNGKDGKDGLTPFINDDGNWQIGNTDLGVKAEGASGDDGVGVSAIVIKNNELIITLSDGNEINLGNIKGDKGDPATNIIQSVNGKTGVVNLTASDVNALPSSEGEKITTLGTKVQTIETLLEGLEELLASI